MTKTRAITIFLFLFSFLTIKGEYFRRIGLHEGLTQPSVMSICQDKLGRMWFGTREGLNVYDGEKITSFKGWVTSGDSLVWLGNEMDEIKPDANGNLYIMSDYNLLKYDVERSVFSVVCSDQEVWALDSYKGKIWYVNGNTIYWIDEQTAERKLYMNLDLENSAKDLVVSEDKIYIGHRNGIYCIDRKTKQYTNVLSDKQVNYLFKSSNGALWIGTYMHGLYWMDKNDIVHKVSFNEESKKGVKSLQIRSFIEDNDHNVWFGSFDGLYKYDVSTDEYRLIQVPQNVGGLTHPSVYSLYKDKQGYIWVGTYYGGVNYFNPRKDAFVLYEYDLVADKDLHYSYIGEMALDVNGHLWTTTDGGGVNCMNDKWEVKKQFTSGKKNSLLHNNVKGIAYDSIRQCMYIATYLGGLSRYDMKWDRFYNYLTDYQSSNLVPSSIVNFIKLRGDKLYTMAVNGFFILDLKTQQFKHIPAPDNYNLGFEVDESGNLYLLGWGSVFYVNVNNPSENSVISLKEKGCLSIPTNILLRDDALIVSTLGSGVYHINLKTKDISVYTKENGKLPSDYCYNITLSNKNDILITSDKGVTYYNPRIDKISTIDFSNIFPSNKIIQACGLMCAEDGTIFVGGTEGVVTFNLNEFHKEKRSIEITDFYFSNLTIEGVPIQPGDESCILEKSMPFTSNIALRHDQNNLKIEFAISDYEMKLADLSFHYKMDGLSSDWIRTDEKNIQFNNLNPGRYTLHVALVDNSHVVKEISLAIKVASPWYNSWIAWIVYLLLVSLTIRFLVKNRIAKRTLALRLENERKEKEHIEQLNKEKLVFFTNVSHEFRTPLTLLISHIDILLYKHSFSPTIYNQLLKIRKNAGHMNNLITELLEFRKLTQNHRKLHVKTQDLSSFLKENFLTFTDYAGQRNITYENHFPMGPVKCTFDEALFSRVIFNLLSNAFKYTPDGGSIILSGKLLTDEVEISVSDTGVGLSEKDVSQIFVRFYQGENQQKNNVNSPGTGIGLALSKAIVEKHHGTISVESVLGQGSVFKVVIPRSSEVFTSDDQIEMVDASQEKSYIIDSQEELNALTKIDSEKEEADMLEGQPNNHQILLVEDNAELLQILSELFAPFYSVLTATNGEEGLQKVFENKVDLIISDIMMPKMSGTEMCLQLKNNIDYCHIPIILLTALDSTEHNIEGLSRGADDYVTKPFHAGLLLARANNLIRSRLLIQHQFEKRPMSEIDLTSINPLDKDLLKKVTDIIQAHIDDPLFDIPLLCKELGVSRSLIYAKFKALTGMTPNNFILNFRLKYAATLLKQYKDLPISEVSDRSGFNSPVYFSQCFKKQFGVTPLNYKKENTNKE